LVDTNILIGFSLWKPISLQLNDIFWNELENALKSGGWVLLDVVMNEVNSGFDGDLKKWCKQQAKNGLVQKLNNDHRQRAVDINNQYPMIDQATQKSTVDTYLIAYAEANGLGVFSREAPRTNADELHKIPDVCDALGIKRLRQPKAFLKAIGFN